MYTLNEEIKVKTTWHHDKFFSLFSTFKIPKLFWLNSKVSEKLIINLTFVFHFNTAFIKLSISNIHRLIERFGLIDKIEFNTIHLISKNIDNVSIDTNSFRDISSLKVRSNSFLIEHSFVISSQRDVNWIFDFNCKSINSTIHFSRVNRIKLMHLILNNVNRVHFARSFAAIFQI